MSVIVQSKDYQRWLDPENQDVAEILGKPPSEELDRVPGEPVRQQPEER
jgi:hypothetical protein